MNKNVKQTQEIKSKLQNLNEWVSKVETTLKYIKKYYPEYETAFYHYEKLISNNFQNRDISRKFYLLDTGCGWKNREVMKHLNDSIFAVGVDIDHDSLKNNISYDKLVLCNLDHLPFRNETFNLITNICVLEHIENPDKVFCEFQRVMKEGGESIYIVPNLLNPLMLFGKITPSMLHKKFISKLLGRNEEDIFHTYFRCNTERALEILANKFGFRRKYLIRCGDFSMFIFSRFMVCCWIIFDKLTNIKLLQKFKMLIVVNYEMRKSL